MRAAGASARLDAGAAGASTLRGLKEVVPRRLTRMRKPSGLSVSVSATLSW